MNNEGIPQEDLIEGGTTHLTEESPDHLVIDAEAFNAMTPEQSVELAAKMMEQLKAELPPQTAEAFEGLSAMREEIGEADKEAMAPVAQEMVRISELAVDESAPEDVRKAAMTSALASNFAFTEGGDEAEQQMREAQQIVAETEGEEPNFWQRNPKFGKALMVVTSALGVFSAAPAFAGGGHHHGRWDPYEAAARAEGRHIVNDAKAAGMNFAIEAARTLVGRAIGVNIDPRGPVPIRGTGARGYGYGGGYPAPQPGVYGEVYGGEMSREEHLRLEERLIQQKSQYARLQIQLNDGVNRLREAEARLQQDPNNTRLQQDVVSWQTRCAQTDIQMRRTADEIAKTQAVLGV